MDILKLVVIAVTVILSLVLPLRAEGTAGQAETKEPGVSKLITHATSEYPRHSEGDIIALSDGKLLMAYGRKTGAEDTDAASVVSMTSADKGMTWDENSRVIVEPSGDVTDAMSVSLCRTRRGVHLFFIGRGKDRHADTSIYQMISGDEGVTWSAPERITKRTGYHVLNNARVIVTTKGRMLVPLAFIPGSIYQMYDKQRVYCLYSDDQGKTWNETGEIGLPEAALMEPGVAECADGSIYMTLRTKLGFLYESRSIDGGLTWKDPQKTALVSPAAPSTVHRDPSSGDLWMFWCANPKGSAATWKDRNPLALVVSRDNGKTWGPQRFIENDATRGFGYVSVDVVDNKVHLTYYDWSRKNPNFQLTNIRHRIIPLEWFRQGD